MPTRTLLVLLILALAPGVAVPQEQPHFRMSSTLVMVDVRVQDGKNRPVKGLTREDFVVFEDGLPQTVTHFQEISIPLEVSASMVAPETWHAPGASVRKESEDRTTSHLVPERRILILLFNLSSMNLQDSLFMRRAAEDFLAGEFSAYDAAAILVFNRRLTLLADLTSDRQTLLATLARLGNLSPEVEVSLPDSEAAEDESTAFIADETEFALFDTNQQLAAIQAVAEAYRDIPGRKSLIYFSPGLSSRGIENVDQLRRTADLANRTNMSVYPVDARGLVALSAGGGAHRETRRSTALFNGRSALTQMGNLSQSHEGLITLAEDTGGTALVDDNDLGKIFRMAREESSHYYLLAYQTAIPPSDGKFHRIEVRTTRPNLKLSFRKGYWAPKPYAAMSPVEREQELQIAILEDRWAGDFPLQISAEFFPYQEAHYLVPVSLTFEYGALESVSGSEDLNLEVLLLARTQEGRAVNGLRDNLEIRPRKGPSKARFLYQNVLLLPPGAYQVTVYMRDNRRGHLARASRPLNLPQPAHLTFSSLVVATHWEESGTQTSFRTRTDTHTTLLENPLKVGSRILVPHTTGPLRPQDTVYLRGRVKSGAKLEQAGAPPQFRVLMVTDSGRELSSTLWRPVQAKEENLWEYNGKFRLASLAPGDYRVRVEIRFGDQVYEVSRELLLSNSAY